MEGLRESLGHKSIIILEKVRHMINQIILLINLQQVRKASGTKDTTRSWDNIQAITREVKKYARMYRRARNAMTRLGADDCLLEEYKKLDGKDLQINKDITEENRFYQRNDTLPWFWMIGCEDQSTMTNTTKEGKSKVVLS